MGNLADVLEDMQVAAEDDFGYPEHAPEWLELGGARVCVVCGVVSFGEADRCSVALLPSGVVRGGGPRISDEAEEFYRQEKWS